MTILQRMKTCYASLRQPHLEAACRFWVLMFVMCSPLFFPLPSYAAKRRVVFQLANLQQWVDLSYRYTGSATETDAATDRSSREHEFEETYHVGIDYAILSRRLANGSLELDIGSTQLVSHDSTSRDPNDEDAGLGLEFLFDMVLFERRPYPVSLVANRTQQRINAPFAENYTLISSTYGVGAAIRHDLFPFQLNYRYFSNETSGLALDRTQISDELVFESTLNWWDFSSTNLRAKIGSTQTEFEESSRSALETDTYDLSAYNLLIWGDLERKNTLNSGYRLRKDTGSTESRSVQWGEDLTLQLGKGLSVGGDYRYNKNASASQQRVENKVGGWIEHRLYESLTTRFDYSTSETEYLTGADQQYRYQSSIAYAKQLPKKSSLNLSYSYGYGELDRNLNDRFLRVFDELVTVAGGTGIGYLNSDAVVADSVTVTVNGGVWDGTELQSGDFDTNPFGNKTEITIDTAKVALYGTSYLVDYDYETNSSIEYSTTTHTVAASLGLFGQKYRLYSTLSLSDQELIEGADDVSPMTQQTFVQFGIEGNLQETTFGSSYIYLDTSISTDKTWETFLSHLQTIGRNLLTLRMTERYSTIEQKEGLVSGYTGGTKNSNSLMFNIDYRKPLMRNTTMNLWGQLADIRGTTTQDDLSLGMGLESRWYRFELFFNGEVTWSLYEETVSREDLLSLKVRRYF